MSLERDDLEAVLGSVGVDDVANLWAALTHDGIERAAAYGLMTVWAAMKPREYHYLPDDVARAAASLLAYVIGSTHGVRVLEQGEIARISRDLAIESGRW